jgi:xanthine dehydrogenase YagR molybdenum-binding subunit
MPWPKTTRYFGKSAPRIEGPAKAAGRARFTADIELPGMLYGVIIRSTWPAARIQTINLKKVRAAPGIRAAIVAHEGEFRVSYYGAELAAIAGITRQSVLDAVRLVEIKAQPMPFVVDELDSIRSDAPRVQSDRANLGEGKVQSTADMDAAFARSAGIVEGAYHTQVEIHHPLEPHGHAVSWDGDEVTAWSSTQGVFSCRAAFAQTLGLAQNRVRVICEHMGGGFGSKFNPGAEGILCAKLARAAGAPVKLMLTRFEQALAVGNRPSSHQQIKLGADAEGRLTAFQLESFGTSGYNVGATTGGGSGSARFPAPYIYKVPATRVKQGTVAINAGLSCAMRAPGHPVASFGMESILDDLAAKLGIDPVEMRLKNDPFEIRRQEYRLGAEKFGWKEKYRKPGSAPGPIKTGIGCAGAAWMSGGRGTQADLLINPDGSVEVRVGTQDLGTGSRTVIQVVAAEMLGIDLDAVAVKIGDTRFPPSGSSGGSTTTASVSPAIYDACENALAELAKTSRIDDPRGANWSKACSTLRSAPLHVRGKWREGLSAGGAGGVQFAEVEVDTETGFVKLRKVLVVQDCGAVVNRLTCESQINGGVIMGIGYALYEERVLDRATGVVLNPNFETYKLPGAADIPEIEIILLDMPERGVIGVGEPCTIPTASAIANAVANALGVRVTRLPITPDKVLAALGKVPANARNASAATEFEAAFDQVAQLPVGIFPEEPPA